MNYLNRTFWNNIFLSSCFLTVRLDCMKLTKTFHFFIVILTVYYYFLLLKKNYHYFHQNYFVMLLLCKYLYFIFKISRIFSFYNVILFHFENCVCDVWLSFPSAYTSNLSNVLKLIWYSVFTLILNSLNLTIYIFFYCDYLKHGANFHYLFSWHCITENTPQYVLNWSNLHFEWLITYWWSLFYIIM